MAIITEEKQSSVSLVSLLIWLMIMLLIGAGAYFIFFGNPIGLETEIVESEAFKKAKEVSKADLNATPVVGELSKMKDYVPWEDPEEQGRENPFAPL